jgi:MFS family permease
MQLPSLRQPAGASVLAGVLGAGVVDALLTARGGAAGSVVLLALGLYGTAALVAAVGAAVVMAGLRGARPPGWGPLADDAERDRAVAAGILAGGVAVAVIALVVAAGQLLLVGNMSSQKLATIAAGGLVAVGALPAAIVAITALPVLRRLAALLPRPRGLGATGFLLLVLAAAGALAFVAALSRADWRVLNLGPLYSLVVAVVLGGAHALFLVRAAGGPRAARAPARRDRARAAGRDRSGDGDRAGRGLAPARGGARIRRRGRRFVGAEIPARRRPPRHRRRPRRVLGALRRRRLR